MEFNSQICTTKEQSERLLALGLKKETADMAYNKLKEMAHSLPYTEVMLAIERSGGSIWGQFYSPAWSLHRLIELSDMGIMDSSTDNIYDKVIQYIEFLIKCGDFNKEYLEDK